MQEYSCRVAYAFGEESETQGSWISIKVKVEVEDHLADADDLENRLLGEAREEADALIDERAFSQIAFVWLLSYEWLDEV